MEKDLKDTIKDVFDNINLPDKNKLWDRLESELDKSDSNKNLKWFHKKYFYGSILLILIGIGFGLHYMFSTGNIKHFSKVENNTDLVIETQINNYDSSPLSANSNKDSLKISNYESLLNLPRVSNNSIDDQAIKNSKNNGIFNQEVVFNSLKNIEETFKPIITNRNDISANVDQFTNLNNTIESDRMLQLSLNPIKIDGFESIYDSIKLIHPITDSTTKDSINPTKKIQFGVNFGIALNTYNFTNSYLKPLNLFTVGIQAKFKIKDKNFVKSILNYSNEALNLEFIDFQNNRYRVDKVMGCRNIQLSSLIGKQYKKWSFETGMYLGYTFNLYGTSTFFKDIYSNSESKNIEGQDMISTQNLEKDLIARSYFRNFDYGLRFGCNYQFKSINLGFSYAQGLRDFINFNNFYKEQNVFNPHKNLYITLGYHLN